MNCFLDRCKNPAEYIITYTVSWSAPHIYLFCKHHKHSFNPGPLAAPFQVEQHHIDSKEGKKLLAILIERKFKY